MSATRISGGGAQDGYAFNPEVGEIQAQPTQIANVPVSRLTLLPGEEAASLPVSREDFRPAFAPLTQFLGPLLTVANPAWTGDPVPRMRALQKKLVEHSLTLPQEDRTDCLAAITVVERSVQLRLRFQQMRMTEADMNVRVEAPKT